LDAVVRGRVQGVGFRWFTLTQARALGCVGWVANEHDGSVHVVAEGSRPALERLLGALREGPAGARVDAADVRWADASGSFATFDVRAGAHPGD